MKTPSLITPPRLLPITTALGIVLAGSPADAITFYKANNITNLNASASWENQAGVPFVDPAVDPVNGAKPINGTGQTDILIWDNRVLGANTVDMGGDIGLNTIRILNPGGDVSINATGRTMTFTANGGVDMSLATQNLTFGSGLFFRATGGVALVQNVPANRTLTLNCPLNVRNSASNGTVSHPGAGITIYNSTFAPTNLTVAAGEVQLNSAAGSTRHGTPLTTVNGGRLVINNTTGSATGSGAVNINNTATLTGQGIMTGAVTIASGATLIPRENAIGTIRAGSLTLAAGSTVKWEGIDPAQADLINVTASNGLTLNGGTFELFNAGTSQPFTGLGLYNLFSYTGALGGIGTSSLAVATASKIAGQTYTFGLAGGFVTLNIEIGSQPTSYWNVDADGNWATLANWTDNLVPNAARFIANLGGALGVPITQPRTVTMDNPHTVGVLNIDSAQPFTLVGPSVLSFDDGLAAATLHVESGSHLISAPLALPVNGLLADVESAASTLSLQGAITGDGGISKSGAGTLVLEANVPFTGTTSIGGGVLQLGAGGTVGSVGGPIANSGTLRYNHSDALDLQNTISGTGGVDFASAGATTLSVANTYSGSTKISAGTIEIANSAALQNSTLTYSTTGGTLTISQFVTAVTLGALSGDQSFPLTNTIADPVSLSVGQNNATTSYSASTTGSGAALTKAGTGTFSISGTHVFTGNTSITGGVLTLDTGANLSAAAVNTTAAGAKLRLNGGTLNSSVASVINNASAGFEIAAGTANFSGISNQNVNDSGAFFVNVTGGALNAGSVTITRGSLNLGTEPATGQTGNGLYINGGAVDISGALVIGNNANSSTSTRIDSGSLTVGGPLTVGINNLGRWSVFDVGGGTFTSTDQGTGVRIGTAFNGQAIMLVRGGVAKAERFQFGQSAFTGSSILNQNGGSLYVGAGGMVVGSTGITAQLRLGGGVLGATADSTSNVPVSLNGAAVVTGADSLDVPHTVSFSGPVTGAGTLTKNGSGSVSFTSPNSSYSGTVSVNSGTLGLSGQTGPVTVASTATLVPYSTHSPQSASAVNGTLGIRYDADNLLQPGRIHSLGTLTLGAGSVLNISGTGTLTAPVYILASGVSGITGTFGSVTGTVPFGYTLNSSFNNGSGFPVIALVSNTASPFDLWIAGFNVTGTLAGPTADADNDGVMNLVEFGQGSNPTQFSTGPALGQSGNFLTLTFNHIAGGNLTFAIEANDDLENDWTVVHTFPPFAASGSATYTDTVALGSSPRRMLRLRVSVTN